MSNPATLSTLVATDAVAGNLELAGPRGARPRRALSPANIMLYSILFVVCLYYILPLWVMVMNRPPQITPSRNATTPTVKAKGSCPAIKFYVLVVMLTIV